MSKEFDICNDTVKVLHLPGKWSHDPEVNIDIEHISMWRVERVTKENSNGFIERSENFDIILSVIGHDNPIRIHFEKDDAGAKKFLDIITRSKGEKEAIDILKEIRLGMRGERVGKNTGIL